MGRHNPGSALPEDVNKAVAPLRQRDGSSSGQNQRILENTVQTLTDQNDRLKAAIVRLTNSLNVGVQKTLVDPLREAVPILSMQIATMCDF